MIGLSRWSVLFLVVAVAASGPAASVAHAQGGGEDCATAELLPCGDVNVATNTANHVDEYDQGSVCTGFNSAGPDVVFQIVLASGASLNLTFDGPYDASIYLITDCNDVAGSCVAGSDTYPPGVPDAIAYTNPTGADQTLYLIVDGFSALDFGPGVLHGTIGCTGVPAEVGACCDRASGGCSVTSRLACAAADGIFQGDGTVCSPSPCPPAESRCVLPGLSVAHDADGDYDQQLGTAQHDIERVSMAEPYGGGRQLVVTMKVAQLAADPSNLPINSVWTVFWQNPVPGDPFPRKFVQMTSCDPLAVPDFVYGHAEPQATGSDLNLTDGPAAGSYTPDGTIRITVDPAAVGNPQPGQTLTAVSGETFVFAPGANCTGLINTLDATPAGTYRIEGNDFCTPFTVSCPADFTGNATEGDIPVSFTVTNPSTASRRFAARISDANGWVVDGPADRTLDLAPGASGSVEAAIRMNENCEPSITDAIQLVVRASDLPAPNDVAQCATTATCQVSAAGVGGQTHTLSLTLASNPVRGEATIRYSIPQRGSVRIDVFSVTGQRLRTMVDRVEAAGSHAASFRLRGSGSRDLGAGVYLVRMTAGGKHRSVRLVALE